MNVNFEQGLQKISKTIVEESLGCVEVSLDCTVLINLFMHTCFNEKDLLNKCGLITETIILTSKFPITAKEEDILRVKIISAFRLAVEGGGRIDVLLNSPSRLP